MSNQTKVVDETKKIEENPPKIVRPKPKYVGYHTVVSSSGKRVGINGYGEKPFWSNGNKCWMYETSYGLGGTSFGYIREMDISRIVNKGEYP